LHAGSRGAGGNPKHGIRRNRLLHRGCADLLGEACLRDVEGQSQRAAVVAVKNDAGLNRRGSSVLQPDGGTPRAARRDLGECARPL